MKIKNLYYKLILAFIILFFFIFNFSYYLHQYYVHTPIDYGYFWQYGYKEAINYSKQNESNYEKIIMTYSYDQPYIYYLFYNKVDPAWHQKNWNYNGNGTVDRFRRVIGKYVFRNIEFSKDKNLSNTLLIGTPNEIPSDAKILKKIMFPDGREAFRIAKT